MFIPVIAGLRSYGEITTKTGMRHATQFVHVFFVPLIPIRDLHPLSVLAAYLRVWGFFALGLLIFLTGSAIGRRSDWAVDYGAMAAVAFVVWAFAMLKLGDPRPSKRTIALVLGVPVIAMAVSLTIGFKERERWRPVNDEIRRQYEQRR